MGLGKGALRKMWSTAKDSVLKNKALKPAEKQWMTGVFSQDLGPTLDDLESLAGKGRSDKLLMAYEKATRIMNKYAVALKSAHGSGALNEDDAEHLMDILKKVSQEAKGILDKVK